MAFNRYFFKFTEMVSSPFSARKRKREQAEPLSDSFSARPTKQAQRTAQPGSSQGFSHQSNTRIPQIPALTQTSLPQPADQDKEASSNQEPPVRLQNLTGSALASTTHPGAWSGAHIRHSQPARELQQSDTRHSKQQVPQSFVDRLNLQYVMQVGSRRCGVVLMGELGAASLSERARLTAAS